jgi:TRAP-type transport system small permease protein
MSAGDDLFPENGRKGRQRPFLDLIRKAVVTLDWSGRLVVFLGLVLMFVLLLANVVLRYLVGSGIAWAHEIHALLLPWVVAGGLVMASVRGRNIAISLLSDMMSGRALLALGLFIQSVILMVSVSILWSSQPILKASQFQSYSTLGFKQIWGYSSLVYAFAAMALIAGLQIVRILAGEGVADRDLAHSSLS